MLLHVAIQRDYELHSLEFSIAFLQGSLHEEIWLRRPSGFTVLQRFGLQHSITKPTPLAIDHRHTGLIPDEPFDVLSRFVATGRHRPVHWTADVRVAKYLATTSGMGLVLGGRRPVVLTGHCDSSYADDVETQRSTQGCFSLGDGAVAVSEAERSTWSPSVASSSAEAEIYDGAMAAQELC
ncbi:unnamed protein product [Closterium sp. NIES-53]